MCLNKNDLVRYLPNETFTRSISNSTILLSKICADMIDTSQRCIDYLKLARDNHMRTRLAATTQMPSFTCTSYDSLEHLPVAIQPLAPTLLFASNNNNFTHNDMYTNATSISCNSNANSKMVNSLFVTVSNSNNKHNENTLFR